MQCKIWIPEISNTVLGI